MALYEFQNGSGEVIEEFFPMQSVPKAIVRFGKRYRRIISRPRLKREVLATQGKGLPKNDKRWWYSRSIGVPKSQVAERNDEFRKMDIHPDEMCAMPDGRIRTPNNQQMRNRALALHGVIDQEGGYGDRTDAGKMYGVKRPEPKVEASTTPTGGGDDAQ